MQFKYLRKGKTALNVAGLERSKFWSKKMSGMSSFCAGCCKEGRAGDEVAGRGEGVVSRDDPGEEAEEGGMAEKFELPEDLL